MHIISIMNANAVLHVMDVDVDPWSSYVPMDPLKKAAIIQSQQGSANVAMENPP
jgi:hypothetical protein